MATSGHSFEHLIDGFRYKPSHARRVGWKPPTPRSLTPPARLTRRAKRTPGSDAPDVEASIASPSLRNAPQDGNPARPSSQKRRRKIDSEGESDVYMPSTGDESGNESAGYSACVGRAASTQVNGGADDKPATTPKASSPVKSAFTSKKKAKILKYADPSVYAHIKGLTDQLAYKNVLLVCGINPGKKSGETGCAYASPSNNFWRAIAEAGLTDQREHPRASNDGTMCSKYNIGMTNLVDRVTQQETELSQKEKREAVPGLLAKIRFFQPRMITFIGKSIFDTVLHVILHHAVYAQNGKPFNDGKKVSAAALKDVGPPPVGVRARSGLSPLRLKHGNGDVTYIYVQFSTSGLCRDAQYPDTVEIFKDVKILVDALRVDDTTCLMSRHAQDKWLEVDLDAFLAIQPPAELPKSVQAASNTTTVKIESGHGIKGEPRD